MRSGRRGGPTRETQDVETRMRDTDMRFGPDELTNREERIALQAGVGM
jgi:hypothetical protein